MRAILRSLYNNGVKNPFFDSADVFFERQITLIVQTRMINFINKFPSFDIRNAIYDEDGVLTETDHIVESENEINDLKSRINLLGISLSVENFETIVKEFINQILKIKFNDNTAFEDFKSTHRTNLERLKFLKKYSQQITTEYSKEQVINYHNTFIVSEQIRHITIHADQIIKEKDNHIKTYLLFDEYFTTSPHPKGQKIILNGDNAEIIIEKISSLGLILFKALCKEHGISLTTDSDR
jgi:hypothetical protein